MFPFHICKSHQCVSGEHKNVNMQHNLFASRRFGNIWSLSFAVETKQEVIQRLTVTAISNTTNVQLNNCSELNSQSCDIHKKIIRYFLELAAAERERDKGL